MKTMYKGQAFSPATQLNASIGAGDTVIEVMDGNILPDAPNYITIEGEPDGEVILYAVKVGNTLSGCTRGVEGTARSWQEGTAVSRNWNNIDYENLRENIETLNTGIEESAKKINDVSEVANNALDAAQEAHGNANNALELANDAQSSAQIAQEKADSAYSLAENAKNTATESANDVIVAQNKADSAYTLAEGKADKPSTAAALPASGTALTNNTEYTATLSNGYAFVFPEGEHDIWLRLTMASGYSSSTWPVGTTFVGDVPEFEAGKTYEISIKNGCVAWGEVVSA